MHIFQMVQEQHAIYLNAFFRRFRPILQESSRVKVCTETELKNIDIEFFYFKYVHLKSPVKDTLSLDS